MGHPSHPSALSVRIEAGAGPLSAAIEATRPGLLQAAAAPIDGRPVRPHVTLARIPRRASSDLRDRAYGWARGLSLVGLAVRLGPPTLYTWSADRNRRLFDQVARSSSGQFPERSGAGASGLPGPGLVRDDLRPGRNGT